MQDSPWHWQGRKRRTIGHSSAAAWRDGVAGLGRAHRDRHRRCRRHHLGHQFPARPAERRSRPDVRAGRWLRFSRQRRDSRPLLWFGHYQRQHGGRLDHVGLRGTRYRWWHRNDVDGGPPRRRPFHDGCWQSSPPRKAPAIASRCLRRRRCDARRHYAGGSRQTGARESTEGRQRHQTRPFRQEPRSGLSRGWQREEYPRPQTTLEGLAGLKPAFAAVADYPLDDKGTTYRQLILQKYPDIDIDFMHHAGNSSGVVDGSAALLLASPNYARAHGLKPRARVVAMANMGDSPTLMLNAPVPATHKVLAKAGLTLDDIDLFEINEAFAVVAEKFIRDLDLDRDKVNVNGGSTALGHPIGATGSILIGTILDELERRDLKRGLVTMCAAGGMAPAIIIERV